MRGFTKTVPRWQDGGTRFWSAFGNGPSGAWRWWCCWSCALLGAELCLLCIVWVFFPLCTAGRLIVRHVLLIEGADKPCWLSFLFSCLEVHLWMVSLTHTPVHSMYSERCTRAEIHSWSWLLLARRSCPICHCSAEPSWQTGLTFF